MNMKAELQEVMNMLRKLQGSIDFGNAPMAEREELASSQLQESGRRVRGRHGGRIYDV